MDSPRRIRTKKAVGKVKLLPVSAIFTRGGAEAEISNEFLRLRKRLRTLSNTRLRNCRVRVKRAILGNRTKRDMSVRSRISKRYGRSNTCYGGIYKACIRKIFSERSITRTIMHILNRGGKVSMSRVAKVSFTTFGRARCSVLTTRLEGRLSVGGVCRVLRRKV